ncbi:MAG: protein kinase [Marinicella sp.]
MDLNKLKAANKIFESLSHLTQEQALAALENHDSLDEEVIKLTKSLIKNHAQSSTFFDEQVSQKYVQPVQTAFEVGMKIDGYELIELIGQGGMSKVFKATRSDHETQKPVAIKIFSMDFQSAEIKRRFQAEQNILAELTHPHIINFHHGESQENGIAYLVMELIEHGLTIDEYILRHRLSSKEVIKLLLQAAQALQYAHNHLIIHRDIKPSNLLVDNNGQLKVVDFGIAKIIQTKQSDKFNESEHTLLALTPSFAAPEQIKSETISVTADVYSLAAVAVLLLTKKQPFPKNRMLTECKDDEQHVRQLLFKNLPDSDLRNVLNKALRTDSQRRYPNMSEFSHDLQAWLEHKPVTATRDSLWYRLNRFAIRHTAVFITSTVLAVVTLSAIIALYLQNQTVIKEAQKAEAVKQFMLNAFSVTDPNFSQGIELSTRDLLRLASERMNASTDLDDEIKTEFNLALALAHGRLGYYPEAITRLNQALTDQPENEQAKALLTNYLFNSGQIEQLNQLLNQFNENDFEGLSQKLAIMRVRANLLAQAGQHEEAFQLWQQLSALTRDSNETFLNQQLLAEMYFLKGDSSQSIEILEQLKKQYALPNTDVRTLKLNADLVQYHDRMGNFAQALLLTEENLQAIKKILGNDHPELAMAYNNLSVFQRLEGHLDAAIHNAKLSEAIYRQRFGDSSEGLAQALSNIGLGYFFKQEKQTAISYLNEAAEMLSEIFGESHPETMHAKANLATILNASGYPEQALPILQNMYEVEKNTLGKSNKSTLYTQQSLALTLSNSGLFQDALEHAKENQLLIQQNFPEEAVFINHSNSIIGRVYFSANQHQQALEYHYKHLKQWIDGNESVYAQTLKLIAQSHQALNQTTKADQYFELWTSKLLAIHGQNSDLYLTALLTWAKAAKDMNNKDQADDLINQVTAIIRNPDVIAPDASHLLQSLNLN